MKTKRHSFASFIQVVTVKCVVILRMSLSFIFGDMQLFIAEYVGSDKLMVSISLSRSIQILLYFSNATTVQYAIIC